MLRASITFFVIALIAIGLGTNGVAGISMEVGRLMLFIFLGLAILSLLVGLLMGRGVKIPMMILTAVFP